MNTSVSEALDRLAPETEVASDWEWVLREAGLVESESRGLVSGESKHARAGRLRDARRLRRRVLFGACVVVATALALIVAAPWKGGPAILQRAEAAISPRVSRVLYMNFGACCGQLWKSGRNHTQLWVETASPRHFRSVFGDKRAVHVFSEVGGTLGPETSLGTHTVTSYMSYNAKTNTLVEHVRSYDRRQPLNFDPLTVVRSALAAGTAHLDGRTVIDGEQAIRITLTTRDIDGRTGMVIYLADARTYHPIEIRYLSLAAFSYPLEPIFARRGWSLTLRFQTFRYLNDSASNLALTNIRVQHPNTRIVRCNGYRCTVIRARAKRS